MKYKGWLYSYDDVRGYCVEPDTEIVRPKTFFKYYGLNEHSIDALTNMYLYATHPYQLNDPFDCDRDIVRVNSEEAMSSLWEHFYQPLCESLHNDKDAIRRISQEAYYALLYRKLGIVSLTGKSDNQLMWSHYSGNNGFCLEFDFEEFPWRHFGPFPLHYVDDIEPVNLERGGHIAMLIQSNVKMESWSYENEWRLLIGNPEGFDMRTFGPRAEEINTPADYDRKFSYPISVLKGVYLGTHFFRDNVVHLSEEELEAYYHDRDALDYRVLDFLSNPKLQSVRVYMLDKIGIGKLKVREVSVYKLTDYKFRIVII